MPVYEFICRACGERFTRILTLADHDTAEISCKKCGSKDVEQSWAAFYAITSKKSA